MENKKAVNFKNGFVLSVAIIGIILAIVFINYESFRNTYVLVFAMSELALACFSVSWSLIRLKKNELTPRLPIFITLIFALIYVIFFAVRIQNSSQLIYILMQIDMYVVFTGTVFLYGYALYLDYKK